ALVLQRIARVRRQRAEIFHPVAVEPKRVNTTVDLVNGRIPGNVIVPIDGHTEAKAATQRAKVAHPHGSCCQRRWGKERVYSFGVGSPRTHLRVAGDETGIIDRKRLRVCSSQGAEIYHSRGFAPEKRAAFRAIQNWAGETDHLVETVNAIRAAEGLLFQSPEIDRRSVTEKSGMADRGTSGGHSKHRRVANHGANVVDTKAAANETARALAYVFHRSRIVRVVTKRCLTRGFRA